MERDRNEYVSITKNKYLGRQLFKTTKYILFIYIFKIKNNCDHCPNIPTSSKLRPPHK